MLVTLGLLALGLHSTPVDPIPRLHQITRAPDVAGGISVWTNREQPYRRGQPARIFFRTDEPGYVTILRIDTDGRIRTLFPRDPWSRTHVAGGRTLEVTGAERRASFTVDDDPGIGYVFAFVSASPFDYEDVTRGDYWDFRAIGDGRIRGDPYVAATAVARRITPRGGYQYDIAPYYVERRYQYPRFVCYDCHSYASYQDWDPYATSCARFRLVIYDDPAYYPYRYYPGRRVVVARPSRPAPRYVFKDAERGTDYVTRARQRGEERRGADKTERVRTSADVGGPGAIPAPGIAPQEPPVNRDLPEAAIPPTAVPDREVEKPRTRRRDGENNQGLGPAPRKVPPVQRGARDPQSTGEPELRRRKP